MQIGKHFRPLDTAIRHMRLDQRTCLTQPLQSIVSTTGGAEQVSRIPNGLPNCQQVVGIQSGGHTTVNREPAQLAVTMPGQVCLGEVVCLGEQRQGGTSIRLSTADWN